MVIYYFFSSQPSQLAAATPCDLQFERNKRKNDDNIVIQLGSLVSPPLHSPSIVAFRARPSILHPLLFFCFKSRSRSALISWHNNTLNIDCCGSRSAYHHRWNKKKPFLICAHGIRKSSSSTDWNRVARFFFFNFFFIFFSNKIRCCTHRWLLP